MNRRGFLQAILASATAPYVSTAAGVLMPVRKVATYDFTVVAHHLPRGGFSAQELMHLNRSVLNFYLEQQRALGLNLWDNDALTLHREFNERRNLLLENSGKNPSRQPESYARGTELSFKNHGVADGIRTHNNQNHNPASPPRKPLIPR